MRVEDEEGRIEDALNLTLVGAGAVVAVGLGVVLTELARQTLERIGEREARGVRPLFGLRRLISLASASEGLGTGCAAGGGALA